VSNKSRPQLSGNENLWHEKKRIHLNSGAAKLGLNFGQQAKTQHPNSVFQELFLNIWQDHRKIPQLINVNHNFEAPKIPSEWPKTKVEIPETPCSKKKAQSKSRLNVLDFFMNWGHPAVVIYT
jgi:hypothetical protein